MTVYRCLNCKTTVAAVSLPKVCRACGAGSAWLRDVAEVSLPGFDLEAERIAARAAAEGAKLTEKLRSPKRDISRDAGEMERESPLFFGVGSNPTLF